MEHWIGLRGMTGPVKDSEWWACGKVSLGRRTDRVVVLDYPMVSRCHAEIEWADCCWWVQDAGSTYGTRLNGVRIGRRRQRLQPKDLLHVGDDIILLVVGVEERGNPGFYRDRGTAHNQAGRYAKALDDLTEAIRLDPADARAYTQRGYAHSQLDHYAQAVADLTEAI